MACCCSLAGTAACDACRNRPNMFASPTAFTPVVEVRYISERTCKRLRPYYGDAPIIGASCVCSECKQELAEDYSYCPNCGAKVI